MVTEIIPIPLFAVSPLGHCHLERWLGKGTFLGWPGRQDPHKQVWCTTRSLLSFCISSLLKVIMGLTRVSSETAFTISFVTFGWYLPLFPSLALSPQPSLAAMAMVTTPALWALTLGSAVQPSMLATSELGRLRPKGQSRRPQELSRQEWPSQHPSQDDYPIRPPPHSPQHLEVGMS